MTRPSTNVSRLAEANMKRWLEREQLDKRVAEQQTETKLGPYVVISRQCGAGGEEIANLLSEKLGWDLVDRQIIENIAKDFNVSKQLVDFVDEKHVALLTELFEAWIEGKSFCQEGYIQDLSKLLMIAAQHGKFVMVGRGSQFILPRDFGLFVQLHAPIKYRVTKVMKRQQLSADDAKKIVTKTDRERAEFLKTYFRNDGSTSDLYDLVIDTSSFTPESVSDLIAMAIKSRIQ